jgi:serine/threonine protein kinase
LGVVARKVFNLNMEQESKHECLALTKIGRHDNIVAFKGCGVIPNGFCNDLSEGAPFIDFEFLDGPSLWDLSHKPELGKEWVSTLPKLCDIIRGLLAAVNHVHAKEFIHLDLKPNNVMVVKSKTREGFRLKPVLIDFGISQQTTASAQLKDHHGTDGYQPPEWWAGAVPTQAYDVRALGAVFYELVHGQMAVQIDDASRRIKNRMKGVRDSNNNVYFGNRFEINTDTAERKERLQWQKKYYAAMEKASSEVALMPRRTERFSFAVPNDVHALIWHMLEQTKNRPTLKEILASPLFKSVQEGTYEQQQFAKQQAVKKVYELEDKNKLSEKEIGKLRDELKRLQQYNAEKATAPKPPKVITVDIAVGTDAYDELSAALQQCRNYKGRLDESESMLEECLTKIQQQENENENERDSRAQQEKDFANVKAALERSLQQEKLLLADAFDKLHLANEINAGLEKNIQEAEARHKSELLKANAENKSLKLQLAAQASIDQPQPRQQQQLTEPELLPDSIENFAQLFESVDLALYDVSRLPTETPKRTIIAGAGARATKRQRTERDLHHLTLDEQQSVADINTTKLPNVDAAWKALDWAYGLYQKNAGDINNPPDVLKQVITNHSKEAAGMQTTSPFEEWLMLVLMKLGAVNAALRSRLIFTKLTGRGSYAYSALLRRYKK